MTKPTRVFVRRALMAVGLAVPLGGAVGLTHAARVAAQEQVAQIAHLTDVRADDDTVRGRVVNRTGDTLRDVRLRVSDVFLRRHESKLDADDPSSSYEFTLPGPIPPKASMSFDIPRVDPLPRRADGRFDTEVTVVSVTAQPIVLFLPQHPLPLEGGWPATCGEC